jgi:O-succinylbenzoic acid--CoA ligase
MNFLQHAKEIALYDAGCTYTYAELDALINKSPDFDPIFVVDSTVECIVKIFSLLRKGKRILPVSPREPIVPRIVLPDGPGTCLMTSGSMGRPKFVLHSLEAHFVNALHPHPDLELSPGCRWRLSLPLNHVGGLAILFRSFLSGGAVILPKASHIKPTHLSLVPTQLKRLLHENQIPSCIKAILVGGAPIPRSLCTEDLPLFLTYGMTEMCSQIATNRFTIEEGIHFGSTLSKRELKVDENGEVWVRGETLFDGYLSLPSPFVDRWFPTGDLGKTEEGKLQILGRKDRMIISGGENIHLEEIEKALMDIPWVRGATVKKRLDEEFGERPVAAIWIDQHIDKEDIRLVLETTLPRYNIPYKEDIVLHHKTVLVQNGPKGLWN